MSCEESIQSQEQACPRCKAPRVQETDGRLACQTCGLLLEDSNLQPDSDPSGQHFVPEEGFTGISPHLVDCQLFGNAVAQVTI